MKLLAEARNIVKSSFQKYQENFWSGGDLNVIGTVPEQAALKYSVFFACLRALAETFATVSIKEYRKRPNGEREETNDLGLLDSLTLSPNEDMTSFGLRESQMYSLNLSGDSVCQRIKNIYQETVGLYPFKHYLLKIYLDEKTNKILYDYNGNTYTQDDVFHVPNITLDGITGMSILQIANESLELGISYNTVSKSIYRNGLFSSAVFEHPSTLSEPAYKRLRKQIDERWAGLVNAGKPLLAEHGLSVKELMMKPVDAQMLESKRFQVEDICRFCRVPPHLVQQLDRATDNNIEQQNLEFLMYTMLPYFKRFEENINKQLLTEAMRLDGYFYEFNMASILRGDAVSMAKAFQMGRLGGWLSVNEIRRMQNLNPIPNGDIYLQPVNMVEAGAVVNNTKLDNRLKINDEDEDEDE